MREHKVRPLPVIGGHTRVGIVAQADVARALPDPTVGDLLEALSTDWPTTQPGAHLGCSSDRKWPGRRTVDV
ncbi:hypothetical protein AB0451_25500 [Streptomyces sp. NPDC052000]|uniref:hypothetical protein n=1 Tax=Streptomyces sp. NPDC052000 TaxID=3155676 RepID=UPI00344D5089